VQVFFIGHQMEEFHFLQFIATELKQTIDDLTNLSNVFINEVKIDEHQTVIKYDILSTEGFLKKEIVFNNKSKELI